MHYRTKQNKNNMVEIDSYQVIGRNSSNQSPSIHNIDTILTTTDQQVLQMVKINPIFDKSRFLNHHESQYTHDTSHIPVFIDNSILIGRLR